jgi:hypothetical protein
MSAADYILVALIAAGVLLSLRSIRRQKRRGGGCCGSCESCGRCCSGKKAGL